MDLNDVKVPFAERIKWMEENEGGFSTPFYEEIDMGDCMCKTCKNPKMKGQAYWRVPAFVNEVAAFVCKNCHDNWITSNDEYWLTKNIKGIENPIINIYEDKKQY